MIIGYVRQINAECSSHDFNPAHPMCVMFLHYIVKPVNPGKLCKEEKDIQKKKKYPQKTVMPSLCNQLPSISANIENDFLIFKKSFIITSRYEIQLPSHQACSPSDTEL